MWQKSENSDPVIPKALEESGNNVILRKNFKFVPGRDDTNDHYEYEEWQMSKEQFEVYKTFEDKQNA